jgi:hypothetical protein
MALQEEITEAIENGRDDLIETLARHRALPTVVEHGGSGLLGESSSPTFGVDPQREDSGALDRQTTTQVVDALGLDSAEDCEDARAAIRDHPAWEG